MKIFVIGSNGREHALAVKYAESKKVKIVFIAPGNGLTDYKSTKIKNIDIQMHDLPALITFAKTQKVDLVDVAQDDCLAQGYVDAFQEEKISVFGPTKNSAQIEWSKEWARKFMAKYKLPAPKNKTFNSVARAQAYIKKNPESLMFVKASGLAFGKGVIRAENKKQALAAILEMKKFGKAGETFLIEEGLVGEEFSLFVICDGNNYVVTRAAQDHKTVYAHDMGPNTGGVGSVAPTNAVTASMIQSVEKQIVKPFLLGMKKEGRPYSGILYVGGMITGKGIKIIEFNARWGDPESEAILPGIRSDYLDVVFAVINKKLNKLEVKLDRKVRVALTACAQGYPVDYSAVKGKEIFGIDTVFKLPHIQIFGSGIKRVRNRFYVNGGRVFHIVAFGKDIIEARKNAYFAMSCIFIEGNNLHYRTDIGWRDVERICQ